MSRFNILIFFVLSLNIMLIGNNLKVNYGYINKNGDFVIKPIYIEASDFSEGLASVLDDQLKIIDLTGKVICILPYMHSHIKPYSEGFAVVSYYKDNEVKSYFVDKQGKVAIDNNFYCATSFSDNIAFTSSNRGIEVIDKKGAILSKISANEVGELCADISHDCKITEGLLSAMKKREWKDNENGSFQAIESWGYIDRNGTWIINPKYHKSSSFSEGLGLVNIGRISIRDLDEWKVGKWGYVDKRGNLVIGTKFNYASDFKEGLAVVCETNTWGFINKKGKYIIKSQFEGAKVFSEGLAAVKIGGKWGFIDKRGKIKIKPIFESDSLEYHIGYKFSDGIASVKYEGKWGYIDHKGNWKIAPRYNQAYQFHDGLAKVLIETDY